MDIITRSIQDSIAAKQAVLADSGMLAQIEHAAQVIVSALRSGHRVLWCGNGGSAADAQHLAAELSGRFYYDRPPLNSEALHCNTSYLTAVANDYGYDLIYARMIDGACRQGDVLIGISTSGNSQNILNAFAKAREIGVTTIALTGKTGGQMRALADILLCVPSSDTPRIQESHIMLGHIICEIVESQIFPRD
ncbi:MAG: D-sedoheptulose 7-phosphate isomerase [Paludibacteraceae bacterium]|nr:D-sedoheptulose 7-phosphate isomerase [Paludibacteraceae bacterium]